VTNPSQSAVDAAVRKAIEDTTMFYQVLIDLEAFDKQFIRPVVVSQLGLTDRENCFFGFLPQSRLGFKLGDRFEQRPALPGRGQNCTWFVRVGGRSALRLSRTRNVLFGMEQYAPHGT
jgi:hypothetical protein